jgi:hypothetical protein
MELKMQQFLLEFWGIQKMLRAGFHKILVIFEKSAEEEGFEPSSLLLVNLFSRQTHSATLPLFRSQIFWHKLGIDVNTHFFYNTVYDSLLHRFLNDHHPLGVHILFLINLYFFCSKQYN